MLHPQTKTMLTLMEERGIPATHTLSPQQAREFSRIRRTFTQPDPEAVAEVRELQAVGPHGLIPMRLYRPWHVEDAFALDAGERPVLLFIHGGGWVTGDLDTHDTLCRGLANGSGVTVIAIDYRLSPEHRFPTAVDDCIAATQWVRRNAAALAIDPGRIAVGGDSAGANIAAVVAIAAREAGDPALAFQLLIYPATDMRRCMLSHTRFAEGYLLTSQSLAYFHGLYIAEAAHDLDWRASPLLHANHAGLPPALVLTAGYDPLRDEGLAYAAALTHAGVRASYVCFERQVHGFITMGRVIDEANTAVAVCAAELRRAMHR